MRAYDLIVSGGGSGGFGAALSASRAGLSVLLVETSDRLGGTSTLAEVSMWEAGVGGTGIPLELYRELCKQPKTAGIYRIGRHCCWPEDGPFPGGESVVDDTRDYIDTLVRYADGSLSYGRPEDKPLMRRKVNGVVFEPNAMDSLMQRLLLETGRCEVRLSCSVDEITATGSRIEELLFSDGDRVSAANYIDSTGNGVLCAGAGVPMLSGQDPRARFNEPDAPEVPSEKINGVTLIFRATPKREACVDTPPTGTPTECWWRPSFPVASVVNYPNGDMNVNMLPTMEGWEFNELGPLNAYRECLRRVYAYWHHAQMTFPEWQGYRIKHVAAELGVRETRRTLCESMLRQQDVEGGLSSQDTSQIIAIADHSIDVHGAHGKRRGKGVQGAYGIPFGCLVPKGMRNMLVACRGAGFSSIAASTCRLSRTMMQIGQAAGNAVVLATELGCDLPDIPVDRLRAALAEQHVALTHPITDELLEYVKERGSGSDGGNHGASRPCGLTS